MKKLFLTSTVSSVAHHIAKKLDLSSKNKLVFITTPVEPEEGDKEWLRNDRQALVDAGFEVTDYTITGKNSETIKKDLEKYDFIYMSGGDTYYLLKKSKESGFIELIKDWVNNRNKIYIGTSAGSIIAGSKCPDYLLDKDDTLSIENQRGYELVNFTILPHWGSENFREKYLGGRMEIAYKIDQVPLILLTDSQYIMVEDGKFEIVDVNK